MPFNINTFLSTMQGDGARPNLFEIFFDPAGTGPLMSLRAQATSLPASTIGVAGAYYFGRLAKFAGDRVFADWQVSILLDEIDYDVGPRAFLERWSNQLKKHVQNNRDVSMVNPSIYQRDGRVIQWSKDGTRQIAMYEMKGCFPTNIGEIPLDWGQNDTIASFPVTFAMQWWQRIQTTDIA